MCFLSDLWGRKSHFAIQEIDFLYFLQTAALYALVPRGVCGPVVVLQQALPHLPRRHRNTSQQGQHLTLRQAVLAPLQRVSNRSPGLPTLKKFLVRYVFNFIICTVLKKILNPLLALVTYRSLC